MQNIQVDFNGAQAKVGREEVCLRALTLLIKKCAEDNIDLNDYRIVLSLARKITI